MSNCPGNDGKIMSQGNFKISSCERPEDELRSLSARGRHVTMKTGHSKTRNASGSNEIRTHNHLGRKRTLSHLVFYLVF